ncbi:Spc24 subunit of Ndc80-domain-containing protein [Gigaspora rosea]|uniref:Kinetochore protein Spc24 n=1 Tax=Gigaspora rosea TaxID=44941 RepID=A0A397VLX5_9GLOM|nr:Spc24 subunit of Ndc80-domain-containing protein [Gigaspora rosea]
MDKQQSAISKNIISEIISLKKKFETSDNIETIQEIQENVRKMEEAMNKKSEQTRNELKALSRKLKALKSNAKRPNDQNERDFNDLILKHEREKHVLNKSITNLNEEANALETTLEELQNELYELEHANVEDLVLPKQDATSLLLHIYRSLGIQFFEDKETCKLKARVEGPDGVHTVFVDDRHSPYFIANYLWELLTGPN